METLTLQIPEKEKASFLQAIKKFNIKIIKTPVETPSEELIRRINASIKPGKKPSMQEIVSLSRPGR